MPEISIHVCFHFNPLSCWHKSSAAAEPGANNGTGKHVTQPCAYWYSRYVLITLIDAIKFLYFQKPNTSPYNKMVFTQPPHWQRQSYFPSLLPHWSASWLVIVWTCAAVTREIQNKLSTTNNILDPCVRIPIDVPSTRLHIIVMPIQMFKNKLKIIFKKF